MNAVDFASWVKRRDRERREHVPVADLLVPLVAKAGDAGITRGEIGKAVGSDLDRDALDALLAGLVEFGLLTMTRQKGLLVFRAAGNFPNGLSGLQA
jgi:putative heme iron utilization protein